MNTKDIRISDFNYTLPEERIAKFPVEKRDMSKLLVYDKGNISQDVFHNIVGYIDDRTLMVFNNTKVIMARIHFKKTTGADIEVFLLEPLAPADYQVAFLATHTCEWCCLVGNLKKWKNDILQKTVVVNGKHVNVCAQRLEPVKTGHRVKFEWDNNEVTFAELIDAIGELPIPPYLNRQTQESDKTTYQTVFSKIKGSVAAPTAGLHFTQEVLNEIDKKGICREEVTLHVGAGTFKPVKSERISGHDMHSERFCVKLSTINKIISNIDNVLAVGTTSVRTLESLYYIGTNIMKPGFNPEMPITVEQWQPYEDSQDEVDVTVALNTIVDYLKREGLSQLDASTQIIIAPGYKYKIVKKMITNFHQPQSTLLLLVSAFVNGDWRNIYNYALDHDFRFLSYGDSSLLIP